MIGIASYINSVAFRREREAGGLMFVFYFAIVAYQL